MKMIKSIFFTGIFLGLGACANMSALQTAQTLAEGEGELAVGLGYVNYSALLKNDEDSKASAPYMEFQYRRGFFKNFDAGMKATLIGTGGVDGKYQLFNGEHFDLAVGTGLAYLSVDVGSSESESELSSDSSSKSTIIDWTLPLYVSAPLSETITLYASPKFMLRKATQTSALSILAATAGVKWGKESGIMLEASYGKALGDSCFKSIQYNAALFFEGGDWF